MPHTTTKKIRTSRIDTRPNSKVRKVAHKYENNKKTIKDIRVTRTLNKKERIIPDDAEFKTSIKKTSNEKIINSLKKKLVAIESLINKQKEGDVLDNQQLLKIETLDAVMQEMERFIAIDDE